MIDAADPLEATWRALSRSALAAGVALSPLGGDAVPWWSATFAGHRVDLVAAVDRAAPLDAWLAALPEAELPLPGRFVADCVVDAQCGTDGKTQIILTLLVLDA